MAEEGTLCAIADVVSLAGANANVTAVAEANVNLCEKRAEGFICGLCRYDFVANYASLTAIAKELLKNATATLSAIAVITYDTSGYTSRVEAEDMLNILWAKWRQLNDIIKEQNFVKWSQT